MPGYLIIEEFGRILEAAGMTDVMAGGAAGLKASVAKAALRRTPLSWMAHGVIGESGVDVDPIAEINRTLDGGGVIGKTKGTMQDTAESAATGDAAGVVAGVASIANTFFDPYKGWIPVLRVNQTVSSTTAAAKRDQIKEIDDHNRETARQAFMQSRPTGSDRVTSPLPPLDSSGDGTGGTMQTGMTGTPGNVARLQVEVSLDVSFPNLLKMALQPDVLLGGKKKRFSAEIHLCTTAAVDMRQVTLGSNSAAAQMVQTLLAFNLQNIVPYLTIQMAGVSIATVEFNLNGDSEDSTPSAEIELEFEKIKWTYHVLNGSNMNLFDVDFAYDIKERDQLDSTSLLGSLPLNPFK